MVWIGIAVGSLMMGFGLAVFGMQYYPFRPPHGMRSMIAMLVGIVGFLVYVASVKWPSE